MGKVEKSKGQRMNCVRTLPVESSGDWIPGTSQRMTVPVEH